MLLQPVQGGAALRALDPQGRPIASAYPDLLPRLPASAPVEPQLLLRGMFTTLADSPSVVLCVDQRRMPVAMEADDPALATACLRARRKPGERLLVRVEGLLATRPSAEPGQPPRTTLVVQRFLGIRPGQRCRRRTGPWRRSARRLQRCVRAGSGGGDARGGGGDSTTVRRRRHEVCPA